MRSPFPRPLDRVLRQMLTVRLLLPLAIALVGMILVSAALVWQATVGQQESLARTLALRVQDHLQAAARVLVAAAGIALDEDVSEAQDHLRLLRESYHQFDAFHRLAADGTVLFAEPEGASEVGSVLPTEVTTDPLPDLGAVVLTKPFLSPRTGQPTVYLVTRVADGGAIAGELSLQQLQEIVDRGVDHTDLRAEIQVLARNGQRLAISPVVEGGLDPNTLIAPAKNGEVRLLRGSRLGLLTLTTNATVEDSGWLIQIETEVFSSLRGVAVSGLLALVLVIGLAIGLVLNFGERLRRSVALPLAMLTQRASLMAQGTFDDDVSFSTVTTNFIEVAELAANFQRMQFAVRQRQIALQASEQRFRDMAEMLPDMILELDERRRIEFANRTVSRLIGYTSKDFEAGMNLSQLVCSEDGAVVDEAFLDLAKGKSRRLLTLRFVRRTQQIFPVEVSLSAIRDEAEILTGYRCVARDISERLKSEESLRRAFQLFTAGPVVVFRVSLGEERRFEYVSPNVSQFGYQSSDFVFAPQFFDETIHPHDLPRVKAEAEKELNNGAKYYSQEYRLRSTDGGYHWVYAFTSVTRGDDNNPVSLDWYIMEITERKKIEERIQVQLQRLAALQTIGAFIENNANLNFTLQTIVVQLIEMLRVDGAAILRFDPALDRLTYLVHDGFYIENPGGYIFQTGESYPGMVALSRKAVPVSTTSEGLAAEFKFGEMAREKFTTYYGFPLLAKGELQGVLEIFLRGPMPGDPEWLDFLETLAGQAAIAIYNADLLENLKQSRQDLEKAYDDTIFALAKAIDVHDQQTEEHSRRLHDLTGRLAQRVGMNEKEIYYARIGALLHDIGKIGIPTELIQKKGELTELDREILNSHTLLSEKILGGVEYLRPAMEIPRYHHERFDGSGYPHHLKGEAIPLAARIFAIADVWDALVNARPYRTGKDTVWSHDRAIHYLRSQKGKYFDPKLVDLFLELITGENAAKAQKPERRNAPEKGGEAVFTAPFSDESSG